MKRKDYYSEFRATLRKMSNNELIDRFNREVRNSGWVAVRGIFLSALRDEFESRNFDYSEIGNRYPSYKYKIALENYKIIFDKKDKKSLERSQKFSKKSNSPPVKEAVKPKGNPKEGVKTIKKTVSQKGKTYGLSPKCSLCNNFAAKIKIIERKEYPKNTLKSNSDDLSTDGQGREFKSKYLKYSGPELGNGKGHPISEEEISDLIAAFTKPYDPVKIKKHFYDMAGYCAKCNKFYCGTHWNIDASGFGRCPKGHGIIMDPYWMPDGY